MKPKIPEQGKPSDEPSQPSWKANIDLWSKLPVLIFLNFICANYEVRRKSWERWDTICFDFENYSIDFSAGETAFILALISMILGFYVTLKEKTKLTSVYRSVFTALGIFSVILGIIMTGHRILTEILYKGPFASCPLNIRADPLDYFQQLLIDTGTLTINIAIMVLLGADPWMNPEVDEEDNYLVRRFKKFSKGYFKCNLFVLFMSYTSILTNVVNEIVFAVPQYFGPQVFTAFGTEIITDRLIWILTFMSIAAIGLYKQRSQRRENNDVDNDGASNVTV